MSITLQRLADPREAREQLAARGLSAAQAASKSRLLGRCAEALVAGRLGGKAPARAIFVPGRIEVLGKHTDYAGGRSLIAAAEQGIGLVAVPREDATIRAWAVDTGDRREFSFSAGLAPGAGHWSNYLMTVARRLARNFPGRLRGVDLAFAGDLPPAAGMSSSSALVVACFMALAGASGLRGREEFRQNISGAEDLADYLGCIENGQTFRGLAGDTGVGTFGGSEDHTAMLCSRAGMLSQYSYCPMRLERRIAMPPGHVFAVASSGIAAEKTGDAMEKYNRASRLAAEVAKTWREATGRGDPHIAAALASAEPGTVADRMRGILAVAPPGGAFATRELVARFEHFLAESEEIIPAAGDALAAGDLAAFGRLADRSQHVAETLLGNQVPETCFLARGARDLGAAAASAFGAGFGGSVWALVRRNEAERFLEEWAARYRGAFPLPAARAAFFLSGAGPAAMELG
ncbi:MAG: galactokinase [Planctomycetota bacterium]|nr:galactokinase [Planctomycetota bacterium]